MLQTRASRWWKQSTSWLTTIERRELTWLLVGLGGCVLLFAFLALAGEVMEGETLAVDRTILLAFRSAPTIRTFAPARFPELAHHQGPILTVSG